jgi:hypothetical protein
MYDQSDYLVESRSNAELRRIAESHRALIDPDRRGEIDIVKILESGSIETVRGRKTLVVIPMSDQELGKNDAISISEARIATLQVKDSVLRAAKDRTQTATHRRAIFTLTHEYFHIVLCHDRGPMARATGVSAASSRPSFIPANRSAEHQANYAAGVLLIDAELARECKTAGEVSLRFNVSMKAATIFIEERSRQQKIPMVLEGLRELSRSIGKTTQSESQRSDGNPGSNDKILCTVCGRFGGCSRSNCCKYENVGDKLQDGDPLMDLQF